MGTNPRDFLAAVGLLRILARTNGSVRLGFADDGAYTADLTNVEADEVLVRIMHDAESEAGPRPWRLKYDKAEKRGAKAVFDLKAPPEAFRAFLFSVLGSWMTGEPDGVAYAASFGTDVAVDGKGNTKPTAFHFTAANQQFLDTVEKTRASVDREWIKAALFNGHTNRSGPNLRWDTGADRKYALMANDPNEDGTSVNAPLEWLAFRGLPLFPVVPRGVRAATTGVRGRSDDMQFTWPLWCIPASLSTVRSLLLVDWAARRDRVDTGIIAVCTSEIRRSAQGFGNFGPASVGI
jgi:hypothetical protein